MWDMLQHRTFVVIAVSLLLIVGLSWIGQRIHVRSVDQGVDLRQREAVAAAEELLLSEFVATQEAMQILAAEAARVVDSRNVSFRRVPDPLLTEELTHIIVPEQGALSIYDIDMRLVAWRGESTPLAEQGIIDRPRWSIIRDDDWRITLVLWEPLHVGDAEIGSIRVTQNLYARAPVRNSILDNYDVTNNWTRQTGLEVQVDYGGDLGENTLRSIDGSVLGTYTVTPPTEAKLIAATATFYDNLMAAGMALLVLWLVWGSWRWYRNAPKLYSLMTFVGVLGLGRIAWLYLEVPARYQTGKAPFSPLFDPVHLASTVGGGLMRTTGDLFIGALCILILGFAVLRYANTHPNLSTQHRSNAWIRLGSGVLLTLVLALMLAVVVQASVLDSTLSYTGRGALLPSSLELVVYISLVLLTLGSALIAISVLRMGLEMRPSRTSLVSLCTVAVGIIVTLELLQWGSWVASLSLLSVCLYLAARAESGSIYEWLSLRRAVPVVLGICLLLYPAYYNNLDKRKRDRVAYAVETFDRGSDHEVSLAVREAVEEAFQRPELYSALVSGEDIASEVEQLLEGTLLSSLGAYDASLTVLSTGGDELYSNGSVSATTSPDATKALWAELRAGIELNPSNYGFVEPQSLGAARYQYAGLAPLGDGWVLVRAQPHIISEEANTPLLRVLLSSGYLDLYEDLSLASYRNGQLTRTFGRRFAKYRLDPEIAMELAGQTSQWRQESVGGGSTYLTYYLRRNSQIIAARMTTDGPFDHLYYLLRLVAGGLLLCIPFCAVGYIMQWRAGLFPRRRVRYQDKVMNAFFLVGVIAVIPVGIAGYNVVTEENEKAVQSWLRQHLERVESTLVPERRLGENNVDALARINIDSLAARVGLDLNLYRGTELIAASRRQLVDDRIVDTRLPAEVFSAIYGSAQHFTFVDHKLGDFEYTAGYRAILNNRGNPAYVLSVPTLPEAERIEEERARTLAYLFGAMLGLGVLVMFTGSVLSRALARPIARLQEGLQEAAQGKFEHVLPVESRDEVGALVKTFNTMQRQLSENRQKLARQERQLAWREMARQIAHEIKNPLTPMKLSIQHLQRSYDNAKTDTSHFRRQFARTTATIVAQIDSLAHIANEFSTFARLPTRKVVHLDLREVINEAYGLMRAEASHNATLELELSKEPLPVRGDPSELLRTCINLIKNALEAVQDIDEGTITVTARQEANQVITEVIDNGPGIPSEVQDRIYEPSFSTKTSGAGLGLAIARQAVELSGGSISFSTELGQGTTMRIDLPLDYGNE